MKRRSFGFCRHLVDFGGFSSRQIFCLPAGVGFFLFNMVTGRVRAEFHKRDTHATLVSPIKSAEYAMSIAGLV